MKYLKKFNENLSTSFLQKVKVLGVQKTKEEIENDIQGLLVELKDIRLDIEIITRIRTHSEIIVVVKVPRHLEKNYFITSDIYEYIMTLIDYIKSKFRVNYISYHYSSLKGESSWNSISDETFDLYDTPLTSTNIKVTDFTIKFDLN